MDRRILPADMRDERFNLAGVVYDALRGAEACEGHARDAGSEDVAAYFREAGSAYRQVAQRGAALLGASRDALSDRADTEPGDIPAGSAEAQASGSRDLAQSLDSTLATLSGGVANIAIGRALAETEYWELRLERSGRPGLRQVAENVGTLRRMLESGKHDAPAVGALLITIGEQVWQISSDMDGEDPDIAGRLERLGDLLASAGRSLSGRGPA